MGLLGLPGLQPQLLQLPLLGVLALRVLLPTGMLRNYCCCCLS